MPESTPLLSQRAYAEHRRQRGLPGGTQPAVHRALKTGRISYAPGTSRIDPERSDRDWQSRTEPRPQFPAQPRRQSDRTEVANDADATDASYARFQARQAEAVNPEHVVQALDNALAIFTAEFQDLGSRLVGQTEPMTVRDLSRMLDELSERIDLRLPPCIHLAYTGEVEEG